MHAIYELYQTLVSVLFKFCLVPETRKMFDNCIVCRVTSTSRTRQLPLNLFHTYRSLSSLCLRSRYLSSQYDPYPTSGDSTHYRLSPVIKLGIQIPRKQKRKTESFPEIGIIVWTRRAPKSSNLARSESTEVLQLNFQTIYPKRCKISSVGQSAVLSILRSSVRFRQKLKKLRTQIYMDLRYIDPQARVLNYFYK